MSIVDVHREITPEELLTLPDADAYELVNGRLVERQMGGMSSWVGGRVHYLLSHYCTTHPLGWVFPSDASYHCFPDKPKQVRLPDVSFMRRGRLPNDSLPKGHIRLVPDIVVEVVSPNDLFTEVDEKVEDYWRAGAPLVWVINPDLRAVHIYRADGSSTRLHAGDTLNGESVLPGFECEVVDLFPPAPSGGASSVSYVRFVT
jgi:Uma2 family endonuclease